MGSNQVEDKIWVQSLIITFFNKEITLQEVCLVTQIEIQKGIQGKKGPVAHMEHRLNKEKLYYILERKTGMGKIKPQSRKYIILHKT